MLAPLNIISLGAGVQSSTMALMAAHGEITPMPDCAIFADTGAEPRKVYEWLDWLEKQLPFPVHRVSAGDLTEKSLKIITTKDGERTYLKHSIPAFILNPDGSKGMARRQCTRDFKIDPIRREVRRLGASTKEPCVTWIGISTDEASRMKPSQDAAQKHRWPLIDLGVSRDDCLRWFSDRELQMPPKSACTFCPYHDEKLWLSMSDQELSEAANYEERLQEAYRGASALNGIPFLHNSRLPFMAALAGMRESPPAERQVDMFNNECEGMCGV